MSSGSQQTHNMSADDLATNTGDSDNESVEVQNEEVSAVLTAVDVNKLVEKSVQSQSILLERIAKTKDIDHRDQLINAVNVYVDAINKLSMAYLVKLAEENISKTFTKEIKTLKSEITLTRQAMESIQPSRNLNITLYIIKEFSP